MDDILGLDSRWVTGIQTTQGLNYSIDNLTTGYTEIEINTPDGDNWNSNLTGVFGGYADTNGDAGLYAELLRRLGYEGIGRGSIGPRLEVDQDGNVSAGVSYRLEF